MEGSFFLKRKSFTLNVKFKFPNNKIVAILGPSGSGKTSFLRCLAGLDRVQYGYFVLNDICLQDSKREIFKQPIDRRISLVFQDTYLFPHLNVLKNIQYGYNRTPEQDRKINPDEVVAELGLRKILNYSITSLSGGEKQRVAIARSLLSNPKLLLLDEPVNSLENKTKHKILHYLKSINEEFMLPIILVTHAINEVKILTDNYMHMRNGGWNKV